MSTPAIAPPTRIGRILVVDDEPVNRELIRDSLEACGYAIEEAASGAEALACIAASPPDVVLLDVSMPVLDGLEVCRRLKDDPLTAPVPVIMVTAHADRRDRLAGINAGANDYLSKPIDLPDLLLRVRNALFAKRLTDEVRDNLRRLQELERLRDSLTHMIIHDLRSPLTVMMLSLEILKMNAGASMGERDLKIMETCTLNTQLMSGMVTALLDVSQLEAGEMKLQKTMIKLPPLVSEVLDSLRSLATRKQIALIGPVGEDIIFADGDILRRILRNLIGNANKFTSEGGEVRVTVIPEGAFARVTVRDTGQGIAEKDHARIFEKFSQVHGKQARAGSGLGLTFCKMAVEAHGGQIGVESEVGCGSTFWFTLPTA